MDTETKKRGRGRPALGFKRAKSVCIKFDVRDIARIDYMRGCTPRSEFIRDAIVSLINGNLVAAKTTITQRGCRGFFH